MPAEGWKVLDLHRLRASWLVPRSPARSTCRGQGTSWSCRCLGTFKHAVSSVQSVQVIASLTDSNVCAMFSCKPEIVHVCCCGSLIVGPKSQALNSHCGRFPRSYCRSRFQRLSSQSVQKQRDEWTPSTTWCLDEVDLYTIYSLMLCM
jgi:hypothetical protein